MRVSEDLSEIGIRVDLEKGKLWSNVIHALFGDSYFRVDMPSEQVTAAVRGTVFEVNLEKNYIHSVNHAVILKDKK